MSWFGALAPVIALAVFSAGCNLFGKLDTPGESRDKYAAAIALANDGYCSDAQELLKSISRPNDDVRTALGWAQLCVGGATAANVASSIYKYKGNSSDLTVMGILARSMLPMTGDKTNALHDALATFGKISNGSRRSLQQALAQFSVAAGLLGNQSANDGAAGLSRTDIADATCVQDATTCSTSATHCTATATSMPDADVAAFMNAIAAAATALQATEAADLQGLAAALNVGLGGDNGRCFIFNQAMPQ